MSLNFSDPAVFMALPHDNRAGVVIGTVCLVLAIATLAVGLRIYTRIVIVKQLGTDDYLAMAALVSLFSPDLGMQLQN
jgi:hypothetical protein